jgi:hypothetical protein
LVVIGLFFAVQSLGFCFGRINRVTTPFSRPFGKLRPGPEYHWNRLVFLHHGHPLAASAGLFLAVRSHGFCFADPPLLLGQNSS